MRPHAENRPGLLARNAAADRAFLPCLQLENEHLTRLRMRDKARAPEMACNLKNRLSTHKFRNVTREGLEFQSFSIPVNASSCISSPAGLFLA